MKQEYIHIDIMRNERFVKSVRMPYFPPFRVTEEKVIHFIQKNYPTLYKKGYTFHFDNTEK